MKYDVADLGLASEGKRRILWADNDMPVLRQIRERFSRTQPLKGRNVSACLHITAETANLARTLKVAGANAVLCASNPLSTQDDVAASLVKDFGIPVFAIRGENRKVYYDHINAAIDHRPVITFDDGADLVNEMHTKRKDDAKRIIASMEETTTGVIRLRAMDAAGKLKFPVIAVNDARSKHLFDNRYGTGQSTVDGILRATNILLAGLNLTEADEACKLITSIRDSGITIIMVEHIVKAVTCISDRIMVLNMGEKIAEGAPDDIVRDQRVIDVYLGKAHA